ISGGYNLYTYTNDNPLIFTDPSGMQGEDLDPNLAAPDPPGAKVTATPGPIGEGAAPDDPLGTTFTYDFGRSDSSAEAEQSAFEDSSSNLGWSPGPGPTADAKSYWEPTPPDEYVAKRHDASSAGGVPTNTQQRVAGISRAEQYPELARYIYGKE